MPGPDSPTGRILCRAGFGVAVAAAASALPPGRPLEADPFTLLLLAALTTLAAGTLVHHEPGLRRLSVATGGLLLAALVGAALHEARRPLGHRGLFVSLVLAGTGSMLLTLQRPPRRRAVPAVVAERHPAVDGRWQLLRRLVE